MKPLTIPAWTVYGFVAYSYHQFTALPSDRTFGRAKRRHGGRWFETSFYSVPYHAMFLLRWRRSTLLTGGRRHYHLRLKRAFASLSLSRRASCTCLYFTLPRTLYYKDVWKTRDEHTSSSSLSLYMWDGPGGDILFLALHDEQRDISCKTAGPRLQFVLAYVLSHSNLLAYLLLLSSNTHKFIPCTKHYYFAHVPPGVTLFHDMVLSLCKHAWCLQLCFLCCVCLHSASSILLTNNNYYPSYYCLFCPYFYFLLYHIFFLMYMCNSIPFLLLLLL